MRHCIVSKDAVLLLFYQNVHCLLSENKHDRIDTLTQCVEWCQFVVNYLFSNLTTVLLLGDDTMMSQPTDRCCAGNDCFLKREFCATLADDFTAWPELRGILPVACSKSPMQTWVLSLETLQSSREWNVKKYKRIYFLLSVELKSDGAKSS